MTETGIVRIGTSGWIYKHWRNLFYPKGLAQSRWLEFYAERFDTVEINFTFYRLPPERVFKSWHDRSPERFRFAVKGSRYITHTKRLADAKPHVDLFFQRERPLGEHAGPILWQLPPDFSRDDARLDDFLSALPSGYRHSIEFRHESWFVDRVFSELQRRGVALCVADSPRRPPHCHLTAGWSYLRLHEGVEGGKYSRKQLKAWETQINSWRHKGIHSWVYFNNDWNGFALENASALMEMLGVKAYVDADAYLED